MTKNSPESGHNSQVDDDLINEVFAEESAILAKIKTLQEEKREVRSKLKGQGILLSYYDTIARVKRLEPEDQDDAIKSLLDAARALKVGPQLGLFADAA